MAHEVVGNCPPCCLVGYTCTIQCGTGCADVRVQFPESFVMGIDYTPPGAPSCLLLQPDVYRGDYDLTLDEPQSDLDSCPNGLHIRYGCNGYAALLSSHRGFAIDYGQACEVCDESPYLCGMTLGVDITFTWNSLGCVLSLYPLVQIHRYTDGGATYNSTVQSIKAGATAWVDVTLDPSPYCDNTGIYDLVTPINAAIGGGISMTRGISGGTPTLPDPWLIDLEAF